MITHELLPDQGILTLTPNSTLEASDFESLAKVIDPYIEQNGNLQGILIDAERFPGWRNFAALIAHFKFIKNHHQKIRKIAVVSDNSFLAVAPKFAGHFVQAEIKHFPHGQRSEAMQWLQSSQS